MLIADIDAAARRLPEESGVGCPVREAKAAVADVIGALSRIEWVTENVDSRDLAVDKSRKGA